MLDLDHFKDFNDRYGHPSGDDALRAFADILRSCLRDGDIAARYGGEEFAVALPGIDEETALAVAERIRSRTETTLISPPLGSQTASACRSASHLHRTRLTIGSRSCAWRMRPSTGR